MDILREGVSCVMRRLMDPLTGQRKDQERLQKDKQSLRHRLEDAVGDLVLLFHG